ncbi:MAG: hypothetical protein HC875_08350 [Anaerolineales bacterium]|nr:hypothetical protein [Anaerolineales bacterium]
MANLLAPNGAVSAELQTRRSGPHTVVALTRLLDQAAPTGVDIETVLPELFQMALKRPNSKLLKIVNFARQFGRQLGQAAG